MLGTVVAHQSASNCFLACRDSSVASRSQFLRVPFAVESLNYR